MPLLFLPSIFPSIRVFSSESPLHKSGQSIGASTLASVLLMNIQGWCPLGLTGLISLQSKGLSRVVSSTAIQKHQFFSTQPSLWSNSHIRTQLLEKLQLWLFIDHCQESDVPVFFHTLSTFVIAFPPRNKHLFILWLQSSSTVILKPKKIKPVTAFPFPSSICHEVMGPGAMILAFWMLSFKPAFSFSYFTFINFNIVVHIRLHGTKISINLNF